MPPASAGGFGCEDPAWNSCNDIDLIATTRGGSNGGESILDLDGFRPACPAARERARAGAAAASRRPDAQPDTRHRRDAAQSAAGRLADVAAHLHRLGL